MYRSWTSSPWRRTGGCCASSRPRALSALLEGCTPNGAFCMTALTSCSCMEPIASQLLYSTSGCAFAACKMRCSPACHTNSHRRSEPGHFGKDMRAVTRQVVRIPELGVVLTCVDPDKPETAMIMRLRPGWDALRAFILNQEMCAAALALHVCLRSCLSLMS